MTIALEKMNKLILIATFFFLTEIPNLIIQPKHIPHKVTEYT